MKDLRKKKDKSDNLDCTTFKKKKYAKSPIHVLTLISNKMNKLKNTFVRLISVQSIIGWSHQKQMCLTTQ